MQSLFLISSIFLLFLSSSISAASFSPSDRPASATNERRSLERRQPKGGFNTGVTCSGKFYTSKKVQSLMQNYCVKYMKDTHSILHPGSKKEKIPDSWGIDATTHTAWRLSGLVKGLSGRLDIVVANRNCQPVAYKTKVLTRSNVESKTKDDHKFLSCAATRTEL